ncbi:DNA adenine methylase [Enterobacter ludwigii]|uniref:DNA adenine methylase n=1 Tax=Enterobacter ludwigii TaxID=299767 RepID=UPI00406795AD
MLTLNNINAPDCALLKVQHTDTSEIYLELIRKFNVDKCVPINVDFRELVHWIKLGDQQTHLLHPYPAKLIPHIAHFFINAKVLKHDNPIVLDPFCGSGTVALEASLSDIETHISDANPLALLIAKVKTTNYNPESLLEVLDDLGRKFKVYRKTVKIDVVNSNKWYSESRKSKLELIVRAINEMKPSDEKDFFKICFSVLARRLSNADPAISVPVQIREKESFSAQRNAKISERKKWLETVSVIDEFNSICTSNIERVKAANKTNSNRRCAKIVSDDVKTLTSYYKYNTKPSLIITSPPYGSAQKYIKSSSLSLNWLGFVGPDELIELEDKSIGREHAPAYRKKVYDGLLPPDFQDFLAKIKVKNKVRYEITKQYLFEMKTALFQISTCLRDKGHVVLVTGNNNVCGEVLRNDLFVRAIMEANGLELSLHLIDDIKSRGLMTKRNKTAAMINRETVMVFHKR